MSTIEHTPAPTETTTINWQDAKIHFGKKTGTTLGSLSPRDLAWWQTNWRPDSRFCRSKITKTLEVEAHHYYDEDCGGDVYEPATTLTIKESDPTNCPDCALRAALDASKLAPAPAPAAAPADSNATGCHLGTVGEKLTATATVRERFDFTTEFNRKKVVQEVAILTTPEGGTIKWKTSNIPAAVKVGEEITLTGTVKDHGEFKGEKITTLKLVKLANVEKLTATHVVTLYCDGKSSADRIAVTNCTTGVLYAGQAGLGIPDNGDNTDHELAAALKALEIANTAREDASLPALRVDLNYDAQWMGGMVGKAKPLRDYAKAHNLIVNMIKIAGTDNPADEWTVGGGERRPQTNLANLVKPIAG